MPEKTNLLLIVHNYGLVDVKMDRSACFEKLTFKMLDLSFSSKLGWSSCIISTAKTVSKKIGTLTLKARTVF